MSELPEGWSWAKLEDLVLEPKQDIVDGPFGSNLKASEYVQAGIPIIRLQNVKRNRFIETNLRFVTSEKAAELSRHSFEPGDVLITKLGDPLGEACIAPDSLEPGIIVADVVRARLSERFTSGLFTTFAINSPSVITQLSREVKGSTRPRVNLSHIRSLRIPIAPLNEQRRIATKLKKLLDRVDAAQARLATIPHILNRFRQSVLAAACSGRLTTDWREANPDVQSASMAIDLLRKAASKTRIRRSVPESVTIPDLVAEWDLPKTWKTYSAAELLRVGALIDIKDGNHGANHPKVSEFTDVGLPFITAAQVNNYNIDYEGAYKISGEPLDRLRVGFAKPGDVVYTHKGSVGRVATIDRDCILTPQTTYYRVSSKIFVNKFLMYYLASRSFVEQVDFVKEQTTRDFVPISEQYLLFHRVPPLAEQQEIVHRVETLFQTADALEARYRTAKAHVDKLTQTILARAFRGELVPQDPKDEPASILMERIRTERKLEHNATKRLKRPRSKRKRTEVTMLNAQEIQHSHLSDILKDRGPLTPEMLWKESQLEIDDFYGQLKLEETRGLLKETSNDASKASRLLEAA